MINTDPNTALSSLANIYKVSDLKVGNFTLAQVVDIFNKPDFGRFASYFETLKWLLGSLTVILLVFVTVLVIKINKISAKKPAAPKGVASSKPTVYGADARWMEILKHIDSPRDAEWKFAIIEADKLVDDILKTSGFPGDSMGDRLMNIEPGQIANLQNLWDAHKVRNRLAHDVNYQLRYSEAKRVIGLYEKVLKEFELIIK